MHVLKSLTSSICLISAISFFLDILFIVNQFIGNNDHTKSATFSVVETSRHMEVV